MNQCLKILGNGQIWDLKGISFTAPDKTFEDLFSGRALAGMAQEFDQKPPRHKRIFSRFRERGKITGLSVTKALLSNNREARDAAIYLLEELAKNAAGGIKALTEGRGFKENWSKREKNYWKDLDLIIIGGGVSEGLTGKTLVSLIKRQLSKSGLPDILIRQARFPGKEAGFLGGLISILDAIRNEGKKKRLKAIAGIGLDLGREEIGAGLLATEPNSGRIILDQRSRPWLFQESVKTPYKRYLKIFLDSRKDYTRKERRLGERIRTSILHKMVNLIIKMQVKAQKLGLACSGNIAVAVPGCTTASGYIRNSTDYLPFFRKQDRFNFVKILEEFLAKKGLTGYRVHSINDGIAAGIANVYFDFCKTKGRKFAFFGVGSGLGGCVGLINASRHLAYG